MFPEGHVIQFQFQIPNEQNELILFISSYIIHVSNSKAPNSNNK